MHSQKMIAGCLAASLVVACVLSCAWGEDVEILLDSANGSSAFVVKDSADTERMRVNSLGEVSLRGGAEEGIVITSPGATIAIGRDVTNRVDNSAAIRGTLYLDGGTAVLYRATFGVGGWANLLDGYLAEEQDPVFTASPAAGITGADIGHWTTAYGWGNHALAGYASAAELSAATNFFGEAIAGERAARAGADQALSNGVAAVATDLAAERAARIGADASLSNRVSTKLESNVWATANSTTNFLPRTGGTMTGALTINDGAASSLTIRNDGTDVQIGGGADGSGEGVAVGVKASGAKNGAAVGMYAQGVEAGVAVGYGADGSAEGVALGAKSQGLKQGVAIGMGSDGIGAGVAVGHMAVGSEEGVAVGRAANGSRRNIAIGAFANASVGKESSKESCIAIGYGVTNPVGNSIRVRGNLYLDGGTRIFTNSAFGSANWGVKAFTIDHPLDPENKVLRHFCLEGPEVWNVYAGNAQLANGRAVVELPDYYSALNKAGSEIYSLTPVGEALVWVEREVENNRFVVAGQRDVKVSWTIKVLRNDPACLDDLERRPVEQLKSELAPGQAEAERLTENVDASSY